MFRPRAIALAIVVLLSSLAVLTFTAPQARADAAGAKKYLDEATKEFENNNPEKAETALKLADAELEGVPANDPVAQAVAALKTKMAAAGDAAAKVDFDKNLAYLRRMAKETLGIKSDNKTYTGQVEELVNSPEGKKFLTEAQRADILKEIATFRKASAGMSLKTDAERLDQALKRAEDKLPETLESVKARGIEANTDVDHLYADIEQLKKEIGELPADDARVKPLVARLTKLSSTFDAEVGKGMTGEAVATVKRMWETYESEWSGWEQETATPSWDEFSKEASREMSSLKQPKTVALVSRADYFLKNAQENERLKDQLAKPEVKAVIDDVSKKREAGLAKLAASVSKVLDEAEKAKLEKYQADRLGYFVDDIGRLLDGDPRQEPLQARAKAIVAKFEGAMAGTAKAAEELLAKLNSNAAAAWPAMSKQFPENDTSFDPADAVKNISKYKGKTVRFNGANNRLGWDYSPGDYDFAVTKNGIAVAGRFDPSIAAAAREVTAKTNVSLPDDGWDVVAVVDGLGKIEKRVSADVTNTGGSQIGTVTGHETVDAPLLRIVAVHAGPLAAAAGIGAASESGSIAPLAAGGSAAAASGGGTGSVWLWRFLTLIIGLAAAACALLKANFAPLAGVPQVGAVRTKLGDDNFGYIGIAFAVLGVIWLLKGMIIYGLFTSLAIIAAGLYVALDLLEAKGIVKPDLAAKVRPLGVMIGLACAALVVLSFITGGALRVI